MHDFTLIHGYDLVRDPGLARLRRTLPVLAVIGAPFMALGGRDDPINPLDPVEEWRALAEAFGAAGDRQDESAAPLALVRLLPPTAARLHAALRETGFDAFQVVHIVAHGERDTVYLENARGGEDYIVAEYLVKLFRGSGAAVLVLDGCFSRRAAQLLLDETPLVVVAGTLRRVAPATAAAFNAHFYAGLSGGSDVRDTFREAIAAVGHAGLPGADRYECVAREDPHTLAVRLPTGVSRAAFHLCYEGHPRTVGVPAVAGFVGRREALSKLAETFSGGKAALTVLHGPRGVGKSALATAFVDRFGWRFDSGVLWLRCTEVTTAGEIVAALAQIIERPAYTSQATLLAVLRTRRVLLVLDQWEEVASKAQRAAICDLVNELNAQTACSVLMVTRNLAAVPQDLAQYEQAVARFDHKEARTLAMRLAVERGLDVLDVDTIDDFLDLTLYTPALIVQGLAWIARLGIDRAFEVLRAFDANEVDPQKHYIEQRIRTLANDDPDTVRLMQRAAGLPDAFDMRLAHGFGSSRGTQQVADLLHHGLLVPVDGMLALSPVVKTFVRAEYPLNVGRRGQVDRVIMEYLTRTWPDARPGEGWPLHPAMLARLNNTRALLARHTQADTGMDPDVLAELLIKAGPVFRAAGLVHEFAEYGRAIRDLLPDDGDLARVQVALGEAMSDHPRMFKESGFMFQVTMELEGLDPLVAARARRSYAQYLLDDHQFERTIEVVGDGLRLLRGSPKIDIGLAADLFHQHGCVLAALGEDARAIKHFQEALSGYARVEQAGAAAETLYALAQVLARHTDAHEDSAARATTLLQRALDTARHTGQRALEARVRAELADLTTHIADVVRLLSDAALIWLSEGNSSALAATLRALAHVEARREAVMDAAADAARCATLYDRLDDPEGRASALVLAGQLHMASGDSVQGQAALHAALDLAEQMGDEESLTRSAGVLVRVHQIRARHAARAGRVFALNALDQAGYSQAVLSDLGLDDFAGALEPVIAALGDRV